MLLLSTNASTRSSAKWSAAVFRTVLNEYKPDEFVLKHFATVEVRDALLQLALPTGAGVPDVVGEVCRGLRLLASVAEGRRN